MGRIGRNSRICIKCKFKHDNVQSDLCLECLNKKFKIKRQMQIENIGTIHINNYLRKEGYIKC